jgi:hypothetical protein
MSLARALSAVQADDLACVTDGQCRDLTVGKGPAASFAPRDRAALLLAVGFKVIETLNQNGQLQTLHMSRR